MNDVTGARRGRTERAHGVGALLAYIGRPPGYAGEAVTV